SWTCFGCGATGDGYGLLAALQSRPVEEVLRERGGGQRPRVQPARTYLLEDRLTLEFVEITQLIFDAIRGDQSLAAWQPVLLDIASRDVDAWRAHMEDMPPFARERWLKDELPGW